MSFVAYRLIPIAALLLAVAGCVTPEMLAARSTELAAATDAILARTNGRITEAHLRECWTRAADKFAKVARDPVFKPDKVYTCAAVSQFSSALNGGDYVIYTSRHPVSVPVSMRSLTGRAPTHVVITCPFRVSGETVELDYGRVPRRVSDDHICRTAWSPPAPMAH